MTQRFDLHPTHSRLNLRQSSALVATAASLAVALAVAPMVALAPTSAAHAATVSDWTALQSSFATGGVQSVTLTEDIVAPTAESLSLVDGDSLTLDLNGKSLSIGDEAARPTDYHAAIGVPGGAALTISDTAGGGSLTVFGGDSSAGIGGIYDGTSSGSVGEIVITGGTISVTGGRLGAGIGGGWFSGAGTILITGGTVTATGGSSGSGIGGGQEGPGTGSITITGGTVTATGGTSAAGIGGGNRGDGVTTTISGGTVTTWGRNDSAGIGGGRWGDGAAVTLSGGSVRAQGGAYSAGIGGGFIDNRSGDQTHPGTLTVAGVAAPGSDLDGGTGGPHWGGDPSGPAADFTIVDGPMSFFATSDPIGAKGLFTLEFGWTATFDAAGGAPTPEARFVLPGDTLTEPATAPSREYYEFSGWRVGSAAGEVWDFAADPVERQVTIVADWTPTSYDLNYDLSGGTADGSNPTTYTTESDEFTLAAPHRSGHVFLGWTGTGLTGVVEPVTIATGSGGDRAYTAHWESDTPVNTTLPTISGSTGLGDTLTASPGSWSLGGLSYAYQWFRGAEPITGADSASYGLVTEDLGTTITVEVTASRSGDDRDHSVAALSASTAIPLGTLAPAPTPTVSGTVSGTAEVGTTLTAVPGMWGPGVIDFSYQWSLDGVPVDGATAVSFIPNPTQLGAALTVAVTGSRANYAPATRDSTGVTVAPGTLALAQPTVNGTWAVGKTLIATAATTPTPDHYSYQWLRDGAAITLATGSHYTLVAADEGHQVSVQVTAQRHGYRDAVDDSASSVVTAGAFVLSGALPISGTPGVGHTLVVGDGPWLPAPAALSYSWLRDGVPIAGATGVSYLLGVADEEAHVSVTVTATAPGYLPSAVTTDQLTIDAKPAITPTAPDQATLTDGVRGGVETLRTGRTITLSVPEAGPDPRWVYVYGYSTPTGLGWHRVIDGTVTVDVTVLGAGTHQLAVLPLSGALLGWASIDLPTLAFTGATDLTPLIGIGTLLLLLGGLTVWLRFRNRQERRRG